MASGPASPARSEGKKMDNRPMTTQEEPEPVPPDPKDTDKAFAATRKMPPSWSMRGKPAMISGDAVPSWVRSIPGPKYNINTDAFKRRQPSWGFSRANERGKDAQGRTMSKQRAASAPQLASNEMLEPGYKLALANTPAEWTMGIKPVMVIGGTVPSWTNSIPGPKYMYDTNCFKERQAVYTLGPKIDFVVGGSIPSWINSIPGPKYTYDTDQFKTRRPNYTIGEKLPTEGELNSKRSPGPIYKGPVVDASMQSLVDSTKKRTCAPGFGIGSRFEGKSAAMVRSGAMGRFEHGKHAFS